MTVRSISLLSLCFCLLQGCATPSRTMEIPLISESQYHSIIDQNTKDIQQYDGLNNVLEIHATLLNSSVSMAQVDQNARLFLWDKTRYAEEKATVQKNIQNKTEVFFSFFTPEKAHNDLHKNKTLWRLFLDVNGQRYDGKIVKVKKVLSEIRSLYPQHTQWTTAYMASFDVPTASVDMFPAKMTLTGPVGSASLVFPVSASNSVKDSSETEITPKTKP